jgi:TolA-binding protein
MNQRKGLLLLIRFGLVSFVAAGCVPLGSQRDVEVLKGDVAQLEILCRELQQNCIDLHKKIDSSCVKIDIIEGLVHNLQAEGKVECNGNDDAVEVLSLYQSAYGDFSMGKFDLAYSGFQVLINNYPKTELAAEAQFYMGECLYSCNAWEKAVEEYNKVEQNYANSKLISSARLKKALCYEFLGKIGEANNIFLSILRDFPQSPESLAAKKKINFATVNNQ